jgi:hypothetical protein
VNPATISPLSLSVSILGIITAAALTAALLEWGAWAAAGRMGLKIRPSAGIFDWLSGLGGLVTAPLKQGEPPTVALGYAVVVAAVILPAAILILAGAGMNAPGSLGVIAFAPLLCALGYAIAAERALSIDAERHRLSVAGRILFATPAWAVSVAVWVGATGVLEPVAAARLSIPATLQWIVALVLVWCGQFILPGAAGDVDLVSRPWGGDAREPSRGVRLITALAHYAGLVSVCSLAGLVLGGRSGMSGWLTGTAVAAVFALLLRVAATIPRFSRAVRRAPRWLVPLVLLAAVLVNRSSPGGVQ